MREETIVEKQSNERSFIKKYLKGKVLLAIVIIVALIIVIIGIKGKLFFDTKPTKLRFEDIGELATQVSYCTEVNVVEDTQEIFHIKIPFTQSKYIYSYDMIIKAGVDFSKIEWKQKEDTIKVKLPEAKILSSELDMESFKVYHEIENIFSPIDLSDNNEALKKMKKNAEKTAIENGLLEEAEENAKVLVKGFIGNTFDLKKYEVVFVEK